MYDDLMQSKNRLSASVDQELLEAAQAAVEAGRADSVSAWVNEALHRQMLHDRRMAAMAEFISTYEAQHGVISEGEMLQAARQMRGRAVTVRGSESNRAGRARKRKSA